jgi:hypothetical protein
MGKAASKLADGDSENWPQEIRALALVKQVGGHWWPWSNRWPVAAADWPCIQPALTRNTVGVQVCDLSDSISASKLSGAASASVLAKTAEIRVCGRLASLGACCVLLGACCVLAACLLRAAGCLLRAAACLLRAAGCSLRAAVPASVVHAPLPAAAHPRARHLQDILEQWEEGQCNLSRISLIPDLMPAVDQVVSGLEG